MERILLKRFRVAPDGMDGLNEELRERSLNPRGFLAKKSSLIGGDLNAHAASWDQLQPPDVI